MGGVLLSYGQWHIIRFPFSMLLIMLESIYVVRGPIMEWFAFSLVLVATITASVGLVKLVFWGLRHRSGDLLKECAKAASWKLAVWVIVVSCIFLTGIFLYPWD